MKILPNFIKTCKENIRDWKILILVIVFAPFFVFLMSLYLGNSSGVIYNIAILNLDQNGLYATELINEWKNIKSEEGENVLFILPIVNRDSAIKMIRDENADLFITIPEDYSSSFLQYLNTKKGLLSAIVHYSDRTNFRSMLAASFIDYTTFYYISKKAGIEIPMNIKFESAGNQNKMSEFDLYIPALLVLSIIMMLFTAGASIIREVEKGTITRLTLSNLSSFEFMTALVMNQIIIGIVCLFLTLFAAFFSGYRTEGSIMLLVIIGIITCFSVISISIITTCFIKNMFGLLTVGCFPFFILIFFSDCFMPLPKINLINLFGNQLYLNDILSTATATRALNKVLNYNADIVSIQFELLWMIILSAIYFSIGIILFKKKYKY